MADPEISGSDARRIMAGEQMAVWEEKTGRREREDLDFFLPAMIGIATERVSRAYYQHKTGRQVLQPGIGSEDFEIVEKDRLGLKIRSRHWRWMVGHLDGLVVDQDRIVGVFEAKHTGAIADWNPAEAVVERNWWQGAHYCLLTGQPLVDFSCLYGLNEWQTFRVVPTETELTTLLGVLNRFARAVRTDTPPETMAATPPPKIDPKRAYTEAELRTWPIANQFADLAATLVATAGPASQYERAEKEIKKLTLPDDTKSIEAHGVVIGVAKNGAKRIRLAEKAPGQDAT